MRTTRFSLMLSLAFGFTLFTQPGFSIVQAADPVVRVQDMPGSIQTLAAWAMIDKGFCKKNGIECQRIPLPFGVLGQQALMADSVDFILAGFALTIQANAKGADLRGVAVAELNPAYVLVMRSDIAQPHRADPYPKNMLDLKGRTVGVAARGGDVERFMNALLTGAGMTPSDVTFVGVGAPNTALAALQAKQVEAVMSWSPIDILCRVTKACNVMVDLRQGQGPAEIKELSGGFAVWEARREYIEKHGAEVNAFSRALGEATVWVINPTNFAEVLALANQHMKLGDLPHKDEMLVDMVKDEIAQYGTHFDRAVVQGYNKFLIKNALITKPVKEEDLIWSKTP